MNSTLRLHKQYHSEYKLGVQKLGTEEAEEEGEEEEEGTYGPLRHARANQNLVRRLDYCSMQLVEQFPALLHHAECFAFREEAV